MTRDETMIRAALEMAIKSATKEVNRLMGLISEAAKDHDFSTAGELRLILAGAINVTENLRAIDPAEVLAKVGSGDSPPISTPKPVAWAESYDGGNFFHTVSLSKTKHHKYPLYLHPFPDAVARLVKAARNLRPYLTYTLRLGGHPTMGSAVGAFNEALAAMEADHD